jgi:hypothetical protein
VPRPQARASSFGGDALWTRVAGGERPQCIEGSPPTREESACWVLCDSSANADARTPGPPSTTLELATRG